jgi:hypothetical protein
MRIRNRVGRASFVLLIVAGLASCAPIPPDIPEPEDQMSLNDARASMHTRLDTLAVASGVEGWQQDEDTTVNCATGDGEQAFTLLLLKADHPIPDTEAEAAASAMADALSADGFDVRTTPLELGDVSVWEVTAGGPGGEQYILTFSRNGGGIQGRSACVPEE